MSTEIRKIGATRFRYSMVLFLRFVPSRSEIDEIAGVNEWIAENGKAGVQPHEIAIFVRSEAQLDRAKAAAKRAQVTFKVLDEHVETSAGHVSICTMHLAKGLEFRVVVVMACDDEVIPLQERIESVGDDADLQEIYDTERHLLYVACTRARDYLLLTGVAPVSRVSGRHRGMLFRLQAERSQAIPLEGSSGS